MVYFNRNDYNKSIKLFNHIIKIYPSFYQAHFQLGNIYKLLGDLKKAKQSYKQSFSINSYHETSLFELSLIEMENGYYEEALKGFYKILDIVPSHPGAMMGIGLSYGTTGKFDKAIEYIEKTYKKDKEFKDLFVRLGWIKMKYRDWNKALMIAEIDEERGRLSDVCKIQYALICGRNGKIAKAEKIIEDVYDRDHLSFDGFSQLGWMHTENRNWQIAYDYFLKDFIRNRLSDLWKVNFAIICIYMNRLNFANELIKDIYSKNNYVYDAFAKLGLSLYYTTKKVKILLEFLEKDEKYNRKSIEGDIIYAMALCGNQKEKEALDLIKEIYSKDNNINDTYSVVGWQLIELNFPEHGLRTMEIDYIENRMSSYWKANFAFQLRIYGKRDYAIRVFNSLYSENPHTKEYLIGYPIYPLKILSTLELKDLIFKNL